MDRKEGFMNIQPASRAAPGTESQFTTERLQLAIFLHANQSLPFMRCERSGNGKVRFLFEDENRTGTQAELEFDRGAAVSATDLFASQKFLRRRMSEALENRRNGKPHGDCNPH